MLVAKKKLLILVSSILVIVLYSLLPWEWGIMDDTEYALEASKFVKQNGLVRGVVNNIIRHKNLDVGYSDIPYRSLDKKIIEYYSPSSKRVVDIRYTGVLRPSFWLHLSTIYLLPANIAYLIRFLQWICIIFFTLLSMNTLKNKTVPLKDILFVGIGSLFCMKSLFEGVALISLQEFSGLFFFSIGMWLATREVKILQCLALFFFIVSTGFKPPFIWCLFFLSIFYFFDRKVKMALISLALFFILITYAIYLAKNGFYTTEIYQFNRPNIVKTLVSFSKHAIIPWAFIALVFLLKIKIRVNFKYIHVRNFLFGTFVLFTGLLYLASMLPRGVGAGLGYYWSPPIYFISIGAIICLLAITNSKNNAEHGSILKNIILLLLPLLVTIYSVKSIYNRQSAINALKKWVINELPRSGVMLATNSQEVAVRLTDIFKIRTNNNWNNTIIDISGTRLPPWNYSYYIVFDDQTEPNKSLMRNIYFKAGSATVFKLR